MARPIDDFLVNNADATQPYYPVCPRHGGSKVTPLIDGENYFTDLVTQINALDPAAGPCGIYIASWTFDFSLVVPPSPQEFGALLKSRLADGVDVRILIWVNDFILDVDDSLVERIATAASANPAPMAQIQADNLKAVAILRADTLKDRVVINTLDHPLGAAHAKFVVLYQGDEAIAYTGGMDLVQSRFDRMMHEQKPIDGLKMGALPGWHDVQVKIEGSGAQPVHDFYVTLWNANLARGDYNPRFIRVIDALGHTQVVEARTGAVTAIADRQFSVAVKGPHVVQSLRTLPNYGQAAQEDSWVRLEPSIRGYESGVIHVEQALMKAIRNAETYIYVEDQSLWSSDLFKALQDAIKASAELRVILVTGVTDPADGGDNEFLGPMINEYLVLGAAPVLGGLSAQELARVSLFRRSQCIVHSKVWIVDDRWGLVGSANFMNRSLYRDIEHSVSFVDDEEVLVKTFRKQLWGDHFSAPADIREQLDDLQNALHVWNPHWGIAHNIMKLPIWTDRLEELVKEWDGRPVPGLGHWYIPPAQPTGVARPSDGGVYGTGTITGTATSITDLTLPAAARYSVNGGWIFCTAGPNEGLNRKIKSHFEETISFEAMPRANDSTTRYILFRPIIERIPLPHPLTPIEGGKPAEDPDWVFRQYQDGGEHP